MFSCYLPDGFLDFEPREKFHSAEGSEKLGLLRLGPTLLLASATLSFARDRYLAASSWRSTSSAAAPAGRQHRSDRRPHPLPAGEPEGCASAPPLSASEFRITSMCQCVRATNHSARRP